MGDVMAIVMAAGKGTRMNSDLPKVLCEVCGRPMIHFVVDALQFVGIERTVVVVGHRAHDVRSALAGRDGIEFVEQTAQLGTGHAVMVCREQIRAHDGAILILAGDSPLTQTSSLTSLLAEYQKARPACILGTLHKQDPSGLGRILRDGAGKFCGIVEEREADARQREITEVNMSTYVFDSSALLGALSQLTNSNRQGEYYITDCPAVLIQQGLDVRALPVLAECESLSINTVEELCIVEAEMQRRGY